MALRWQMECLNQRLSIHCNFTSASAYFRQSGRSLSFSVAPSHTIRVNLALLDLLRQVSPEVVQVDAVELGEIVGVDIKRSIGNLHRTFDFVLGEACDMCAQVMLVVRVLLNAMEKIDFLAFFRGQGFFGMITLRIIILNFFKEFFEFVAVFGGKFFSHALVFEPVWSHRIE